MLAKHVLAVTHTRKSSAELATRLRALGINDATCKTFHAAALGLVQRFAPEEASRQLVIDSWPHLRRIMYGNRRTNESENASVVDCKVEIELAQARMETPETLSPALGRPTGISTVRLGAVWSEWVAEKQRLGLVEFGDYLTIATDLLTREPDIASIVHNEWRMVVVDEYQDIDRAQQTLLAAILGEQGQLCAVGDPRQTIFSFKGSEPTFLTDFARYFPGSEVRYLNRNYRSTQQIVGVANRISQSVGKPDALISSSDVGSTSDGLVPSVLSAPNVLAEARLVAEVLARAHLRGQAWNEMAVLYRLNVQSGVLEGALRRQAVPFEIVGDRLFYETDAVLEILRPFGRAAKEEPTQDGMALLVDHANRLGWNRFDPPEGFGGSRRRWDYQTALVEQGEALVAGHGQLEAGTLRELYLQAAMQDSEPSLDRVTLASIHRAKGLEWDEVVLFGATEGLLPFYRASSPRDIQEERRLFYVGATRARKNLTFTHALTKTTARGQESSQVPSRFLVDVEDPLLFG